MTFDNVPTQPPRVHLLDDDRTRSLLERGMRRWENCRNITDCARRCGLDANVESVNRNYQVWCWWARGGLATGYLIKQTGVKRIETKGTS